MAPNIALMAPAALGLSGAPVHEPVHAGRQAIPLTVTQRHLPRTWRNQRIAASPSFRMTSLTKATVANAVA